jgi:tetratricopeptide (TPR) repeat protein
VRRPYHAACVRRRSQGYQLGLIFHNCGSDKIGILEAELAMPEFRTILVLLLLAQVSSFAPVRADDFPGKGDRFAWSKALPFYNRANKYLEHGRYEEAKADLEEAIYNYEYDPDFYINYGVVLRKLESYTAAEEAFKKAIELRGNDWQAWSNLANAYLKQNRLKDTIACFQKAMKMNPPPPQAEKEAMLKDIEDINKILKMQAPPPAKVADKAPALAQNKKTGSQAKKSTPIKAANAPAAPAATAPETDTAASAPVAPKPVDKQALKKSGWDWVQ